MIACSGPIGPGLGRGPAGAAGATGATGPATTAESLFGKTAADASAGATFGEIILFYLAGSGTVSGGWVLSNGNATANDTNYGQVVYTRYNSSNVSQGVMFTQTTRTTGSGGGGSWVANQPWSLGTASNNTYSDGDYVTVTFSKPGGTGVTLPACKFAIKLT